MEKQSENLPAVQKTDNLPNPQENNLPASAPVFDTTAQMPDVTILKTGKRGNTNLVISYHKFQKDTEVRGVFKGFMPYTFLSKYSGQMETKIAAVWASPEGRWKMSCAAKIVSTMQTWLSDTPFAAIFTGLEPSGEKNIAQFDIYPIHPEK